MEINMAANDNDINEILPCSIRNNKKIHVLFLNKTLRSVYVIWLNFSGERVIYATLSPNHILPMYTFECHAWIFEDARTGDRMLCDGEEVFVPVCDNSNNCVKGVLISNPFYSLRRCALNAIRDNVSNIDGIDSSQLPDTLLEDIRRVVSLKQKMLEKYENCSRA